MRVLHIGSLSSQHTQIAALTYRALGYQAVYLNTRRGFCPPSVPGIPDADVIVNPWPEQDQHSRRFPGQSFYRSLVLVTRYLGRPDARLIQTLRTLANEHDFDVIVGTWGVPVLEAMMYAQRVFPNAAMVHNILTFPDLPVLARGVRGVLWRAYMRWFDRIQIRAYRAMLAGCDTRVHCSQHMLSYLTKHVGLNGPGEDVIRIERFNRCFFPAQRLPKLSITDKGLHIVHIGATNFTGQPIDNLSASFTRLARAQIHVHFSGQLEPHSFSEYDRRFLHSFAAIPAVPINGHLAEFMTQYDATVILFNVDRRYDRFVNSLPTRFLFSLVAGIPLVMPKGLFQSCEDYINEHQIGFAYEDEEDLAGTLRDSTRMAVLNANALKHSSRMGVEDGLPSLECLFARAIATCRARSGNAAIHSQNGSLK